MKKNRLNIKTSKHKYILTEYKYIFFELQNSSKAKIFFLLNVNKKILNIKMHFCNISATIAIRFHFTYLFDFKKAYKNMLKSQ